MIVRYLMCSALTLAMCTNNGRAEEVATTPTPVASAAPIPPPPACSSGGATQLTVVSRHNATGHWLGEAWVERAALPSRPLGALAMHISHERRRCGDATSVVMHVRMEGPPDPVRRDYHFYKGFGYYKAHAEKVTWIEAKNVCEDEGAHLVVLNSPEEAEIIKKMVPTLGDVVFIGIHDMYSEGHFMTVLGEPLESTGYVLWAKTEPNGKRGENCVDMYASGEMNDVSCNKSKYAFVCEYPSV